MLQGHEEGFAMPVNTAITLPQVEAHEERIQRLEATTQTLVGHSSETRVKLDVSGNVVHQRLNSLSDAELLELITKGTDKP
jgi:hypothetical protein